MFRCNPFRFESKPASPVALSAALAVLTGSLAAAAFGNSAASAADQSSAVTAATADLAAGSGSLQTAVLSGGCFWGTQGVFEHVKGVRQVLA